MITTLKKWMLYVVFTVFTTLLSAQDDNIDDLINLSLEDLMSLEVTSVSKKVERLRDVASAVYLINEEDIQRSGATTLQDLLQMHVPGVFVAANNYNSVDFGLRARTPDGFSGSVLVLVDNVPYQSMYTSSFIFEDFDFDLDEIDRIEVIRGPGGTIYGANAATGIINIFTKQDQNGWRAGFKAGNRSYIAPSLRYAGKISGSTNVKVFAKGNFFDGFAPIDEFDGETVTVPVTDVIPQTTIGLGTTSRDTTITNQLGEDVYRTDKIMSGLNINTTFNEQTKLSVHGYSYLHQSKVYYPSLTAPVNTTVDPARENTRIVGSARFDKEFNDDHSFFSQFSYNREELNGDLGIRATSIFNLEVQDNVTFGIHNINTGLTLRSVNFKMGPLLPISGFRFTDERNVESLWGVFIQDQLRFSDVVDLTLGVKAETWNLIDSEPEWSPSLRFSVKPNDKLTLWGAASRSVTTPGYVQTNFE
ncbi:MAG: TonB-dependent receptor, partial [Bacteroidota bacterium]